MDQSSADRWINKQWSGNMLSLQDEKSEQTSEYALYGDVYIDGQDEKSGVCGIYSAE